MLIIRLILSLIIIFILSINTFAGNKSQPSFLIGIEQNTYNPPESVYEQFYNDNFNVESLKTKLREIIYQYHNPNIKREVNQTNYWYGIFLERTTDWLLVLFNFLLVIVTGFLVLYNSRLWKTTEKLWRASIDQSVAMDQSINEAARSAIAMEKVARSMQISTETAKENVEIFRDVREKQLRAWVFVADIGVFNVASPLPDDIRPDYQPTGAELNFPKSGPSALLIIKNSGNTPSYNTTNWVSICFKEYPLNSDLPEKRSNLLETKATIPQGGQTTLSTFLPEPLTSEQIENLRRGNAAIYIHGGIIYTDVFGEIRNTNFRFMHGAMSGIIGINKGVTICEECNDAN